MVEKVTGVKFTPSSSQLESRWASARAKKAQLLRASDWTQLRDVYTTLSPQLRNEWNVWRQSLRNLSPSKFSSPEQFDTAIDAHSLHSPGRTLTEVIPSVKEEETATSELPAEQTFVERPEQLTEVPIPVSSMIPQQMVIDVVMESSDLIMRKVAATLGINLITIHDRVAEAADAHTELLVTGSINPSKYPFAQASAEMLQVPIADIVSNTLASYTRWLGLAALINAVTQKMIHDMRAFPAPDLQELMDNFEMSLFDILKSVR